MTGDLRNCRPCRKFGEKAKSRESLLRDRQPRGRALLKLREDVLAKLQDQQKALVSRLSELQRDNERYSSKAETVLEFVYEQLFWIRSFYPVSVATLTVLSLRHYLGFQSRTPIRTIANAELDLSRVDRLARGGRQGPLVVRDEERRGSATARPCGSPGTTRACPASRPARSVARGSGRSRRRARAGIRPAGSSRRLEVPEEVVRRVELSCRPGVLDALVGTARYTWRRSRSGFPTGSPSCRTRRRRPARRRWGRLRPTAEHAVALRPCKEVPDRDGVPHAPRELVVDVVDAHRDRPHRVAGAFARMEARRCAPSWKRGW